MQHKLFLPTLPHWNYGNNWSGSLGKLRFFMTTEQSSVLVEVWDQDVCRELAQIRNSAQFELSQKGLDEIRVWLEEQSGYVN